MTVPSPPARAPVTGVRRAVLYVTGLVMLGIAYLAALLPGLPATPWLAIASYCFARTSPRLQRWLWYSPGFGPVLRDFTLHRGMRPASKRTAIPMIVTACTASIVLAPIPNWVRASIAASGLTGIAVIVFAVPTVRNYDAGAPQADGSPSSS